MKETKGKIFYGWIIVACCFICASGYGVFYSLGVFYTSIQQEFKWSATLISSIHSVHLLAFGIAMPVIGRLSTKYGVRNVFLFCSFLIGLGFALCSQTRGIWDYYVYYGIASIGGAVTTSLPMAIVQKWFVEKRGMVIGLVSSGVGFGAMVVPVITGIMIANYGWRFSYLSVGIASGFIMITASLFIIDSPSKIGLKPYGQDNGAYEVYYSRDIPWKIADLLKSKTFFIICVIWIFGSMTTHLIIVHLVPFAEGVGMNKTEAGTLLGLVGGISIVTRICGGLGGEKVGWRRSLILCSFSMAIVLIWLCFSKTRWMIYLFVILYGGLFGMRLTIIPGLIGSYYGTKELAEIMSYFWSVAALAGLVGPLVGGLIFDKTGSYLMAFFVGFIWYLIIGFLSFMLKPPGKRIESIGNSSNIMNS